MALDDAVPSSAADVIKRNGKDFDLLLQLTEGLVTTRTGKEILPWQVGLRRYLSFNNRGAWATATAYQVNDIWESAGTWYVVLTSYTSGATAAADISAGFVQVLQNVPSGTAAYADLATDSEALAGTAGVIPDAEQVRKNHVAQVGTMVDLLALTPVFDGQQVYVSSYHDLSAPLVSSGGGTFVWDAGMPKTMHDGGHVIAPEAVFPVDWDNPTARFVWLNYAEYVTPGNGCWVRANVYDVNVVNFGAKGDGVADDYTSLQFATYATKSYSEDGPANYYMPHGRYRITKPILFYSKDGLRIRGDGKVASVIIPDGPMTPLLDPNFIALQALGYDDYTAVPACFIISTARLTGPNEVWSENLSLGQWHIEVDGLGFIGDSTTRDSVVGIYGPVMASARFDNILYKNLLHGFKSEIFWRTVMRNNDFTWLNGTPISMEDSTTRGATGTSVSLENCGAYYTRGGFYLTRCHYSTLNNCAVDHWTNNVTENGTVQTYAYQLDGCKGLVMNGCGAEDGKPLSTKGLFNLFGQYGSTTINGGSFAITGNPAPTEVSRMDDDHKLHITNALYKNDPNSLFGSYFNIISGEATVDKLVDSNVYSTVFQFDAAAKFYGAGRALLVNAKNRTSVAMVPSTTSNVDFGTVTGSQPNTYSSYDNTTKVFTAPFGGVFKIDVTVRFLGSGVETVKLFVGGSEYDSEPNFFPSTTNVQTYTASATVTLGKGSTVYATLQTTAGATGSTTFANMSIAQVQ